MMIAIVLYKTTWNEEKIWKDEWKASANFSLSFSLYHIFLECYAFVRPLYVHEYIYSYKYEWSIKPKQNDLYCICNLYSYIKLYISLATIIWCLRCVFLFVLDIYPYPYINLTCKKEKRDRINYFIPHYLSTCQIYIHMCMRFHVQ